MKTQSTDTHPDTERVLIHLIRNAPMSKRFRLVQSLTQGILWSRIQGWRQASADASEQEAIVQIIASQYGPVFARQMQVELTQRIHLDLQPTDPLAAMLPIQHAFDERDIFWYLGGSIASSLHGMQQLAPDVDLVVDLSSLMLSSLLPSLKHSYDLAPVLWRRRMWG